MIKLRAVAVPFVPPPGTPGSPVPPEGAGVCVVAMALVLRAVSTPPADAEDRLSKTGSAIPPVNQEVLTLKNSAFLAQLLMDEVDLAESTPGGAHDHAVFSIQATVGPTCQVPGAKLSPSNMPISWYNVQDLQQVL